MIDNKDNKPDFQQHQGQQNMPGKKPIPPRYKRGPFFYLIIAIVIFISVMMLQKFEAGQKKSWSEFIEDVNDGKIESIEIGDTEITGKFKPDAASTEEKVPRTFTVNYNPDLVPDEFLKELEKKGIVVNFPEQHTWLLNIISMLLPIVVLVAIFYFLFVRNLRG